MGITNRRDWFSSWFIGLSSAGGVGRARSAAGGRARERARRMAGIEVLEGRAVMTAVVPTYSVTQNWGRGFQGQLQLANKDTVAVPNWTVSFDLAANLTSVWDGALVSHVGTRYTVTNAGWNATLPVGGTVGFGFVATPGATGAASPPSPTSPSPARPGAMIRGNTSCPWPRPCRRSPRPCSS